MKKTLIFGGLLLSLSILLSSCATPRLGKVHGQGVAIDSKKFADLGIVPKGVMSDGTGYTINIETLLEEETDEAYSDDIEDLAEGSTISIVDMLEELGIHEEVLDEEGKPVTTETKPAKEETKPSKKDDKKTKKDDKPSKSEKPSSTKPEPAKSEPAKTEPAKSSSTPAATTAPTRQDVKIACDNVWLIQLKEWADTWLGVPYLFGGTTRNGIDCSAFTGTLYKNVFEVELKRNSRQMYSEDVYATYPQKDLVLGDLLFFVTNGKPSKSANISHVGVYVGDGIFVHSSSSKGVVYSRLTDAYWVKTFLIGGRVLKWN